MKMKLKLLSLFFALFLLPFVVMGQCGSNLFVNDADGNSYATLKVGPHCWMQSNLKTKVPGSLIYRSDLYPDTNDNLAVYGRLYSWYAAMNIHPGETPVVSDHGFVQGVCPDGWHLPTDTEITQLATYSAPSLHDVRYWLVPGTNTTNYTMRPGGYYNAIMNRSENICGDSYMWTAQSLDESSPSIVWSDCHCDYYLIDKTAANNGMSVRCVYKIYQGTVTTDSATNITDKSATLYGTVAFNGYDEEYERGFVYGTSSDNLDQWVVENQAASEATAPFNKEITGLSAATTYYYQAYIINDFDTAYGEVKSFATKDLAVTTNDATDVKSTSATLNGELTKLKGYENATVGFRYGQHKDYMVFFADEKPMTSTGSFDIDLSNISPNTTYFFQAYAYNETDTAWAVDTLSFRTLTVPCLGAVRTNERGTTDAIDSVIDNEGNAYIAVKIGNQCWMAQNLRTQNTNGYGTVYTNYDVVTYGRYYTWTAMMQGSASSETNPSGVRGICPEGWHIPSLSEWRQLSTYVKDAGLVCTDCSGTDDDKRVNCIPNALASTIGWKDNSQICTPGCKLSNKNATGFSAVPAGYYYSNGYLNFGEYAIYFMATTNNAKIYYSSVNYNNVAVHLIMTPDYFDGASSVRCVRDAEAPAAMSVTTDSANTVTSNSAKLYGNVTNMGGKDNVYAGFKYGTSESTLTSIAADEYAMYATGQFSYTITGLTANTQYYYKAFAANGTDTVYGEVKDFTTAADVFTCGTSKVKDIDNNEYNTVQIGTQCWMAQNLRTNVDGGVYPKKGDTELTADEQVTYGRLYTWDAMMSGSPSTNYPAGNTAADTIVQGICPVGWHVPSNAEWTLLTNYVSRQSQYVCDNDIAKALASTTGWNSSTVTCAVGKIPDDNNKTGFSALPAGYYTDSYEGFSNCAYWWSATEGSSTHAYYRGLGYGSANVYMNNYYKSVAFSVRCLRDAEVPAAMSVTTDSATTVTKNGATLYGNVTSLGTYDQVNAGFKYGTSGDALTTIVTDGYPMWGSGRFNFNITGLTANTQYFYKAFAANGSDTVYGEVKDFTTAADIVTDTIAFVPNGGQGAMDTMFVTRGDTVLNANAYTHSGNWQFVGWNTEADGSGTQYANQAAVTTNGNLTLYAQWHTWCTGTPNTSVNEFGASHIDSVKDIDNNKYNVVQIGTQCWLKENLRTSTNGAGTGNIYTPTTTGYDVETYGRLYDWDAVMQGASSSALAPSGVQGICPDGWHVPSSNEWDTLTNYVNSKTEYQCNGDKTIAKALAGTTGWISNSNNCNVGKLLSSNNSTGFSALPASVYYPNNLTPHSNIGKWTFFSSATVGVNDTYYCTRGLANTSSQVSSAKNTPKVNGLSVRCLRDAEAPAAMSVTTDSATTVTKNGAKLYGTVASLGDNEQVTAGFRYGQHPDYMTFKAENTASATGSYNAELTGISPNTTYYFQAYAATATDTAWATDTLAFTTLTNPCQGTAKGNEHASSNGIDSVRDSKGNSYLTVQIGSQCWMAQNLRTETVLGSYNPSTEEERYDVENYGLLYTWDTAAIICPQGWHLPSNTEWNTLSATAGVGMSDEGTGSGKLAGGCTWNDNYDGAPTGAGNYLYPLRDSTGFSALPTGAYHTEFHSFGDATQFWCANSGASAGNAECYIMYHGIEYNYIEEEQTENLISVRCVRNEEQPPFTCGTSKVKDIDNNEYNTVPIGNQCWMKENLRTTKYANGTAIEVGTSTSTTNPYRYAPNRNESNVATYGYLYNWVAVMNGANSSDANPSGVQGICPTGWHVPSDAEWTQLTNYVSSQSQYVCDNDNNIAKALASTTGWNSSTETCAVGNIPDNNNKTGFSALPAGGVYGNFGGGAYVWSATEGSSTGAYYRNLYYKYAYVNRTNNGNKGVAFSVRCLRDAEVPAAMSVTTDSANTVTKNSAKLYGNVTDMGGKSEVNAGFKYGTSEDALTSIVAKEDAMTATGQFSCDITGLTANTQYYYKAFAANGSDTVYGEVKDFTTAADVFTCGTSKVKDIDNNEYNTVQIGNQCWMKENLRTNVGSGVYPKKGDTELTADEQVTYGRLYTWDAMMSGSPSTNYPAGNTAADTIVHGICPTGWHVPSDAEWTQLTDYVSSQSQYVVIIIL